MKIKRKRPVNAAAGEVMFTNEIDAIYDALKRMEFNTAEASMFVDTVRNPRYAVRVETEHILEDGNTIADETFYIFKSDDGRIKAVSENRKPIVFIDADAVIQFFNDYFDQAGIVTSACSAVKSSTRTRKTKISAAYDKTRQKLQDACEGFIGRKADDVLDELDSMGFSDHSSSPVREDGKVIGRREVFWSADYDTDIVIEYDKQTEEVYNAYTEETADNKAGVGAATKTRKTPIKADAADVYENSDDTFEEIFYDVCINDNHNGSYYEREEDAIEVANQYAADPAYADDEITVVLEHYMTDARGEIIDYFEDNGAVVWSSMDAIYDSTQIKAASTRSRKRPIRASDDSIEMYAVVDGHTIVGDLYDTYNEALSEAKQFVDNADGVVRVLALDCIVTDDDIYYGESVEDGRVLWSSDGTLEGDGFIYSSAKTAKRMISAARKINFLITVTDTDEVIDVQDDQDAAIEVARQYTQKWGDSATVEKQYIGSNGETFDSVVVYQTDADVDSSSKTAKSRIISNSDVYTLRMNGPIGNLSEPMEFDNVKDAVSYASSCDLFTFYMIEDSSGNVIKRGRCNTKKMAKRPIKAAAGSDPYKLIKEHKDAFVDGWASEYEGEPETSWDNIFDNVLEEFRTYCGDEASDFIIDEYNEGRYTEGDMMSAFEQFIMFLDIPAYDE